MLLSTRPTVGTLGQNSGCRPLLLSSAPIRCQMFFQDSIFHRGTAPFLLPPPPPPPPPSFPATATLIPCATMLSCALCALQRTVSPSVYWMSVSLVFVHVNVTGNAFRLSLPPPPPPPTPPPPGVDISCGSSDQGFLQFHGCGPPLCPSPLLP